MRVVDLAIERVAAFDGDIEDRGQREAFVTLPREEHDRVFTGVRKREARLVGRALDGAAAVERPCETCEWGAHVAFHDLEVDGSARAVGAVLNGADFDPRAIGGFQRHTGRGEAGLEFRDGDVLHGGLGGEGEVRGETACVAEHHEDGLHAYARIGDVGRGDGGDDEEIFHAVGREAAVGDFVGVGGAVEIAFEFQAGVGLDHLDAVAIGAVAAHTNGVGFEAVAVHVVLREKIAPLHPACDAHVNLGSDVIALEIFVLRKAVAARVRLEVLRQCRIVLEHIPVAEPVVLDPRRDAGALLVVAFAVTEIRADEVGLVRIQLAVDLGPTVAVGIKFDEAF